jgi:hypothetical protein
VFFEGVSRSTSPQRESGQEVEPIHFTVRSVPCIEKFGYKTRPAGLVSFWLLSSAAVPVVAPPDSTLTPDVPRSEIPVGSSVIGRRHGSPHTNPNPAAGEQRGRLRAFREQVLLLLSCDTGEKESRRGMSMVCSV